MPRQSLRALILCAALAAAGFSALAADVMPMPYREGKGHPDPTRPGVTVPSLAEYIKQLYANQDERAQALGDGLCMTRYPDEGKLSADVPIVDFWQENKDLVVLLLMKREYAVICDWTDKPNNRKKSSSTDRSLCRPQPTAKTAVTTSKAKPYWYCRPCPPTGCKTP